MTQQQVTQKVNEYKSQITALTTQMNGFVNQRLSYTEDSQEYKTLSEKILKLERNILSVKHTIGI